MEVENVVEEGARRRRERLERLRNEATEAVAESAEPDAHAPPLRNYQPHSEELAAERRPVARPADVRGEVEQQAALAQQTAVVDDMDLSTLAPRKVDWDLKRDVAAKLEKLDRRTQRAIAQLIRDRLASGKEDLLLSAVNSSVEATQQSHASDDED